MYLTSWSFTHGWISSRILIASIQNLGTCPCPRCLIPLTRVHNIGTNRDMSQQNTMARVDNSHRRHNILSVRRFIYDLNYQVNSAAVEAILRRESWVATQVRTQSILCVFFLTCNPSRMRSPSDYLLSVLIYTKCCFRISCTSLSWVCGEQSSSIFCESFSQLMTIFLWS